MNNFTTKIAWIACFCFLLFTSSCKKTTTTPEPTLPTSVTDADGNTYPVIKIGNQLWMAENLRTSSYNDGTPITTSLSSTNWSNASTGAFAVYNDDITNNAVFGKLYNWHAVNSGKLAPTGWHVATSADWTTLVNALGGSSVAGGKLKSTSTVWIAPNVGATNSSGFNGLPGGFRSVTGGYSVMGNTGYWWARDERNSTQGDYFSLDNGFASSFGNGATKTFGYSIRCVYNQ